MTSSSTQLRPTRPAPGSSAAGAPAPRPVVCLTDHLYRDRAVARDAERGRFTHHGRTLDLGRRPDWLDGGHDGDEEWRIEWVKLYEGMDLAHAYAADGDDAALETWQDLVESFCVQVPIEHDTTDVTARRVQNWLYAWQAFAVTPGYPGLRPGLAARLVRRIRADADHVAGNLTAERNHRTLELYTLLLVTLALDGPTARADAALAALAENAETDIWADGVHRECSTDYHCIVLRSLLGAIANARRFDLAVPATLLDRAGRACDFALHVQRPDGSTPALSDGDEGDFRHLLAVAADLLARPELDWAATAGRRGTPPARRMVTFPFGGYLVQRSGWGDRSRSYADERWSVFDCGPIGDGGPWSLRPAVGRAHGRRASVGRRPRALHLRRGRRGLAPPLQGHRRAQHGHRGRAGPDALPRRQAEGTDVGRATDRAMDQRWPRRHPWRGPQPLLRRRPRPHACARR